MEPYSPSEVKRRLQIILRGGELAFTRHARSELTQDGLSTLDAENVLRGGWLEQPDLQPSGVWRYRMTTRTICVVVEFDSDSDLVAVVVTAFRTGGSR